MRKDKGTCRVQHCDNDIKHPQSGLCGACYARSLYWARKTPTARVLHQQRLMRNAAGMQELLDYPHVELVQPRKRRRRR